MKHNRNWRVHLVLIFEPIKIPDKLSYNGQICYLINYLTIFQIANANYAFPDIPLNT